MPADHNAERLAACLNERRIELGFTWEELARQAAVSSPYLRRIRYGEHSPSDLVRRKLETALRWLPGSIDAILDGQLPANLDDRAPEDMDWATVEPPEADFQAIVGHWGALTDFTRQLVLKIAREARLEAEQRNRLIEPGNDAEA